MEHSKGTRNVRLMQKLITRQVPHSLYNETLEWVPCYTGQFCARLMVGLIIVLEEGSYTIRFFLGPTGLRSAWSR